MQTSFTKLGEENGKAVWGIRIDAYSPDNPQADALGLEGQEIEVRSRFSGTQIVRLGNLVEARDAGKVAVYTRAKRRELVDCGITAADTLLAIAGEMSGREWSADTLDAIAGHLRDYGIAVADSEPKKAKKAKKNGGKP